jgi:hypothetical protein
VVFTAFLAVVVLSELNVSTILGWSHNFCILKILPCEMLRLICLNGIKAVIIVLMFCCLRLEHFFKRDFGMDRNNFTSFNFGYSMVKIIFFVIKKNESL